MRRMAFAIALFMTGTGLLLTGALSSAASAATAVTGPTISVTNPGARSFVTSAAITPVTITAADSAVPAATFTFTATGLPAGLAISAAGVISGTPTVQGPFAATVIATEATGTNAGMTGTASFTWTITATAATPPVTGAGTITVAYPGHRHSYIASTSIPPLQIHATDSTAPGAVFTFTESGLPPGLMISTSGLITGSPTIPGTYSVTVTAATTPPGGATATGSVTFPWTIYTLRATATPTPTSSATSTATAPAVTPAVTPTITTSPTAYPVGGVVTGGGGSLGGGSAALTAAGAALILAGAGTGAYAIRRRAHRS